MALCVTYYIHTLGFEIKVFFIRKSNNSACICSSGFCIVSHASATVDHAFSTVLHDKASILESVNENQKTWIDSISFIAILEIVVQR